MLKSIVTIKNLDVHFYGKRKLFVENFQLTSGKKYLITGASGQGKSLFMQILLGLINVTAVKKGDFFCATVHEKMNYQHYKAQSYLAQSSAVIFQDAIHSLHPYQSIQKQTDGIQQDYFRSFQLDSSIFLNKESPKFPGDCSGGECQRISLMLAVYAKNRNIIMMDEPLTDIDLISRRPIETIIKQLMTDQNKTIVLITHQWEKWAKKPVEHFCVDNHCLCNFNGQKSFSKMNPMPDLNTKKNIAALKINQPFAFSRQNNFRLWPTPLIHIKQGKSLGLIGESGSGKSTFLRMIAGLFSKHLYKTHFRVDLLLNSKNYIPFVNISPKQRYSWIQLVFQDTCGTLVPNESLNSHFNRIVKVKHINPDLFNHHRNFWAKQLGITMDKTILNTAISELSMGMARRFSLLRAFLLFNIYDKKNRYQPRLLLLDEVARGLDADNINRLVNAIRLFKKKYHISIIAISHDLSFIRLICNEYKMMFKGCLLPQNLTTKDLDALEQKKANYMNPYYQQFMSQNEPVRNEQFCEHPVETYAGCLYLKYYQCEHYNQQSCPHQAFVNQKEIGICS